MPEYVCRGPDQLKSCASTVAALNPAKVWRVTIAPYRVRRSGEQNNRAWAIYRAIADETGHNAAEIHEICKRKFGEPHRYEFAGVEVEEWRTRDKDVGWMSQYIERLESWAASEFGVAIGG